MQIRTTETMKKDLRLVTASSEVASMGGTRRVNTVVNPFLSRVENHKAAALAFLDKYDAGFEVEYSGTGITSGGNIADYWTVVN